MTAEILCVGTELLLGDIVNTNAAFLAKELAALGISVYHQTVVGDNPERLRDAFSDALGRCDIVITSGGLGPTCDDLTKETLADLFSLPLVLDKPSLDAIELFFKTSGRTMCRNNNKQAMIPKGAVVFKNNNGTAPGLAVTKNGKTAILLPGPPREIEAMFNESVRPFLEKMSGLVFVSHTVHLFGIGESAAEERLRDLMDSENPTVAPYAKDGEVVIRVTARAENKPDADALSVPVINEIRSRLGQFVYGVDVGSLQNAVVKKLSEKKLTVSFAESCTGGYAAKRITEIPGSSAVFGCGIVSYSNDTKINVLGVSKDTIENFSAVSAECAAEMAMGVRKISGSDIAVSVTGYAGPGTSEKEPVGLVYIGLSTERSTSSVKLDLSRRYGSNLREYIRYVASSHMLYNVLKLIDTF